MSALQRRLSTSTFPASVLVECLGQSPLTAFGRCFARKHFEEAQLLEFRAATSLCGSFTLQFDGSEIRKL